jgi:hypothetical protein
MTDRELLSELQYVLIEPPDGGDTFPSLIWTRAEVLDAVNAGVTALAPVVPLPTNWLATAHLVWRDTATQVRTPLGPVDAFESDLAVPGWEAAPGLPLGYADLAGPTLTLRLVPTPDADGTIELLYIAVPPDVAPVVAGAATPLPLAPEVASALKYAALGTLLRKVGRLLDDERAHYAERRYELTQTATSILLGGFA